MSAGLPERILKNRFGAIPFLCGQNSTKIDGNMILFPKELFINESLYLAYLVHQMLRCCQSLMRMYIDCFLCLAFADASGANCKVIWEQFLKAEITTICNK